MKNVRNFLEKFFFYIFYVNVKVTLKPITSLMVFSVLSEDYSILDYKSLAIVV